MKVAQLATLAAVLREGSFAAAASAVGLTPSAVSLQMKQLEEYFGQALFDRSGQRARPTRFAIDVAEKAQDALALIESLRSRRLSTVSGRVRLGVIPSVQTSALPVFVAHMRAHHPALDVDVLHGESPEFIRDAGAGRIDAAVVVRPSNGGPRRLVWNNIAQQPFVLVAPPDAPSDSIDSLLQKYSWLRYDPKLTGGRISAQFVQRLAPGAKPALDLMSTDAIVAMVSAGLGFSVIPQPRSRLLLGYPVRLVSFGRIGPVRQICLVHRREDAHDRRIGAVHRGLLAAYA